MSALFDELRIDPGAAQGNVIDVSGMAPGQIKASDVPGFGDGTTVYGLRPDQEFIFDDMNTDGPTNWHNIAFAMLESQEQSGSIHVLDDVMVDGLEIAGNKVNLSVDGLVNDLNAQGTHVFAFDVGQTGSINGMHFGEATVQAGTVSGTIENAHFNNASLGNITFKEGAFLHNANFSGASINGLNFEAGVNLEDIYVDTPSVGRGYFASVEMMRAHGLAVEGVGNVTLSNEAVASASRIAGKDVADLADTLSQDVLNAFKGLGAEVQAGTNGIVDAGIQTGVLDGAQLAEIQAAAENARQA